MTDPNAVHPFVERMRRMRKTVQAMQSWKRVDFHSVPGLFGNAMPKSGSHLMLQILQGIAQVAPFRGVEDKPIRMITCEGRKRSSSEVLGDLGRLKSGMIGWGYLQANPEFIEYFNQHPNLLSFFVYRDPRDQLISSIFYAVDIHTAHAQHDFYASIDMDHRINTAISGREEPGLLHLPNIRQQYDRYLDWLDCPNVFCLRFEDLIQACDDCLLTIFDNLENGDFEIPTPRADAFEIIKEAIRPEHSPTFRKGKAGGWREHFSESHKQMFKDITGDLLVRLGYETDDNW